MIVTFTKVKLGIGRVLLYLVLIFFIFVFALPFYYNFIFATENVEGIFYNPPPIWFGEKLLPNISKLFNQIPAFGWNFMNTVLIAVLATGTQVFFCTMAGFAFAKYRFKGKEFLYRFVLITLMIPPLLHIIPLFRMMAAVKVTNTYFPLVVPNMANAFGIFLMTQFIGGAVPEDLIDAARIDGLGETQILFHVCFPLARPGLAVLATVAFVNSWNEFIVAKVMMNDEVMYTLPVALSSMNIRADGDYGAMMVGNAISILPLLIAFLLFSKQIIANLTAGSMRG